jgi:transposase
MSKERLEVHLRPSAETFTVGRDGQGLEQLVARLAMVGPALVVLEATGGFEITVAAALAAGGLPLAVVNPAQIRAFACAHRPPGQDRPARCRADRALRRAGPPEPRPVLDKQARTLAELVARGRQIVEIRNAGAGTGPRQSREGARTEAGRRQDARGAERPSRSALSSPAFPIRATGKTGRPPIRPSRSRGLFLGAAADSHPDT